MKSLKIGFIGSGFIAQFMAKAMKQVRHCELTAIYNRSGSEDLARYAKENGLGYPKLYDSIKDLCKNSDVVAILTPNFTRIEIMEEIAWSVESGADLKYIICEKPLGRTIRDATRMVELAREAGLKTAYFENQVHMNAVNNGLEQLRPQRESMGDIVLARSTEEHAGPHNSWFWDPVKPGRRGAFGYGLSQYRRWTAYSDTTRQRSAVSGTGVRPG